MRHTIELLDENGEYVFEHKRTYPSLSKAMAIIFDLQIDGNVRITREDGHRYNVIVYPTIVIAQSVITGRRYIYWL